MNIRTINVFYSVIALMNFAIGAAVTSKAYAADRLPSETVSYSDLNVSSPEGMAGLRKRIQAAAERVCRGSAGSDAFAPLVALACERRAEAQARGQIPQLSGAVRSRGGALPALVARAP